MGLCLWVCVYFSVFNVSDFDGWSNFGCLVDSLVSFILTLHCAIGIYFIQLCHWFGYNWFYVFERSLRFYRTKREAATIQMAFVIYSQIFRFDTYHNTYFSVDKKNWNLNFSSLSLHLKLVFTISMSQLIFCRFEHCYRVWINSFCFSVGRVLLYDGNEQFSFEILAIKIPEYSRQESDITQTQKW